MSLPRRGYSCLEAEEKRGEAKKDPAKPFRKEGPARALFIDRKMIGIRSDRCG